MSDKELKVQISNKISKSFWIILAAYIAVVLILVIVGFSVGGTSRSYWRYGIYFVVDGIGWFGLLFSEKHTYYDSKATAGTDSYPGNVVLFIFIIILFILLPLIVIMMANRKRKLTQLLVSEKEAVGSYTAFIPVSKITLRMPIEKIDNIAAVKSFFFIFTGKTIKISSTSGVIRIPYVINADEVVGFISEAIEKVRKEQANPMIKNDELTTGDYTSSLKKLAELRDAGIITEEEFNQKKVELLDKI